MTIPIVEVPVSVVRWLAGGERGLSSETIVSRLCGLPLARWRSHPLDPADLRRCLLLLEACPELAVRLDEMRGESRIWRRLVDAWPKLIETLEREVPDWRDGNGGKATETYALMKQAERGGTDEP